MVYKTGILLGQITKTSGFEGAVLVKLEKKFIENIPDMESVFVETDGRPVPFFIEWSEYTGSDVLRLKFEGYGSVDKVEELKGSRVFLTYGEQEADDNRDITILTGFAVVSQDEKILGTVMEIIANPGQMLLNIETPSGGELLIPLHQDLIRGIDKRKKLLHMDIPEGLTEINS